MLIPISDREAIYLNPQHVAAIQPVWSGKKKFSISALMRDGTYIPLRQELTAEEAARQADQIVETLNRY